MDLLSRDERGFTLVEVLVALLVLSVIMVAGMELYNSSISAIMFGGRTMEALLEAQYEVEQASLTPESSEHRSIVLTFPNGIELPVDGHLVKSRREIAGGKEVVVTLFVPQTTREK